MLQLPYPLGNVADVGIEQRVDVLATFRWGVPETQEHSDFVLRHVKGATSPNEGEAFEVHGIVDPVVAFRSCSTREQPFALVVTNGVHRRTCLLGELTDFHCKA